MEARIARIESDVGHIKETLATQADSIKELRGDMKAANQSIARLAGEIGDLRASLGIGLAALSGSIEALRGKTEGSIETLRQEMKGGLQTLREQMKSNNHALEVKMIRWMVGTVIAVGGLCFSIARFFS